MSAVVKDPDEPTVIDEMAAEAVPEPVEYPAGTPLLKPYVQIRPRSKRALFKRQYAQFTNMQDTVSALSKAARDAGSDDAVKLPDVAQAAENMRLWADADDLYQQMDDLMRLAAVDDTEYTVWSDQVDDKDLIRAFQAYMQESQPGEASSSAT